MGDAREIAAPREALDFSHHLSTLSKSRHPSPLKDIIKYMGFDGMISLAGGLPHPSLFPVQAATFTCLDPAAPIIADPSATRTEAELVTLPMGRTPSTTTNTALNLTPFLQYGSGAGNPELLALARQLTDRVHKPLYHYECLLHPGNTNAWAKVVELLCEKDDHVLVEEFTYPSAQALWIPLGIMGVPVQADAEGMSAEHLESILAGWATSGKPGRRPRVLYSVSIGSNPTGLTISTKRRTDIYNVCAKYDVMIVEDDPYYFLQYPHYDSANDASAPPSSTTAKSADDFVASLTPSFLSLDHEGRVIRLESFSKTLFPGLRLGYFVANPLFTERLLRATEVETQDPAGLSQALVLSLLRTWTIDGYLVWMQSIRTQYHARRNWLLGSIAHSFVLLEAAQSPLPDAQGWVACLKEPVTGKLWPVFSFVDPTAGMFLWTKFYFSGVPRFREIAEASDAPEDPEKTFADELWMALAQALVLLTPGSYYHPWQGPDKVTTRARGADPQTAHFRLSFATPTQEQIEQGVQRLAAVLARYYLP